MISATKVFSHSVGIVKSRSLSLGNTHYQWAVQGLMMLVFASALA